MHMHPFPETSATSALGSGLQVLSGDCLRFKRHSENQQSLLPNLHMHVYICLYKMSCRSSSIRSQQSVT